MSITIKLVVDPKKPATIVGKYEMTICLSEGEPALVPPRVAELTEELRQRIEADVMHALLHGEAPRQSFVCCQNDPACRAPCELRRTELYGH